MKGKQPYVFSWKRVIRNWIIFSVYISFSMSLNVGLQEKSLEKGLIAFLTFLTLITIVYSAGFGLWKFSKKFS